MNCDKKTFPQYTVNGRVFGTDYETALMYWQLRGGVMMKKLDHMTPAYVLCSRPLDSSASAS